MITIQLDDELMSIENINSNMLKNVLRKVGIKMRLQVCNPRKYKALTIREKISREC